MKKLLFLVVVVFFSLPLVAQNPMQPFDDISPLISDYDPCGALKTLRTNKHKYTESQFGIGYYNQALATVYSMLCYSPDSILLADYRGNTGRDPKVGTKNVDTIDLSAYKIIAAKEYLLNRAKRESVLIINEAHTRPDNRLLLKSMLAELYEQGYKTLCLEVLGYQQTPYSDIKTITDSGYYTKEPCFAEMLRHALSLGYAIYGYEATVSDYKTSNNRDSLQAAHLRDIRSADTCRKMIIWAGYGHTAKSLKKSMYNYFCNLTGVTPLSINQTSYVERPTQIHEKPLYIALWNNCEMRQEVVLEGLSDNSTDVYIFAPRIKHLSGRPDYLRENGTRRIKSINVTKPQIIKAYYANEYAKYGEKCVPVDIIFAEKTGRYSLFLPCGDKFRIIKHDL